MNNGSAIKDKTLGELYKKDIAFAAPCFDLFIIV